MKKVDEIEIRRLAVATHIGVPEEERFEPQTLWLTIKLQPLRGFIGLEDDVANTVDYSEVALAVTHLAAKKPRQLIETLANEVAAFLLSEFPISSVEVEVEKHILPNADFVSVRVRRKAAHPRIKA